MKNKHSSISLFEKTKMLFPVLRTAESGHLPHANLKAEDPRQKLLGMRSIFREESPDRNTRGKMDRGFTLIELLVVVLIIGILASIALPQYQKAVATARFAEVRQMSASLEKAMDLYILANGFTPSGAVSETNQPFDISYPCFQNGNSECFLNAQHTGISYFLHCHSTIVCEYSITSPDGYAVYGYKYSTAPDVWDRGFALYEGNNEHIGKQLEKEGWRFVDKRE